MTQSVFENEVFVLIFLVLSVFRIYLEVIGYDFNSLPMTKKMIKNPEKFHKYGFYFSIGYFVLFAPTYLLT